jgi:hypothetical protein
LQQAGSKLAYCQFPAVGKGQYTEGIRFSQVLYASAQPKTSE